ncbi:MAG: hypothetical protein ACLQIB_35560 [Isosphaeraceae bacterium]
MQIALTGNRADNKFGLVHRRPFDSPAGFKLLVPGWPQLFWDQRERGMVLLGSFILAILVGVWTWGTYLGWAFFAFAFLAQVTSTTDALRQSAFPAYSSRTSLILVCSTLGLFVYLPATLIVSLLALPCFSEPDTGTGYAVNRWAYRHATPRRGDWIWAPLHSHGTPHAALIVATGGQEVEWTGQNWRIDGLPCPLRGALRLTAWPQTCRFHVPSDQILVEPEVPDASQSVIGPLVLVRSTAILGRAWAQLYPMRDRHLL